MKVKYKQEIRFRDIDSMGHVNNAVYLSYFEQARMSWFREAVGQKWNWIDHGILVARHEIDYKKPVSLSDEVEIITWVKSVGNSSLVMTYEVVNQHGDVCTLGSTVLVCYDYNAQKTIPVPEVWKKAISGGGLS